MNPHLSAADWLALFVVVILVALSALMSLAETSLTRTSKVKALALLEQQRRGAKRLLDLVEQPSSYLSTVLLVTLVSQLVAATLVGILADRLFGPFGVVVATVVEIVVIFVFGEAVPKNVAVVKPESTALISAPVVKALIGFWPVKALARGISVISTALTPGKSQLAAVVSEEELLAMADAAEEGEVIETEERALIHSVISFGDTIVREVMVPRPDIVAVSSTSTVTEAIELVINVGRSRLPVFEDSIDNIVGIVLAKDLLALEHKDMSDEPVGRHMRPAHFVPESKSVASLLREMKAGKFHMVVVVDEYGSTSGLVSLEDLIEELIGDIEDEFDVTKSPVVEISPGMYEVTGTFSVDDLAELLDTDFPDGEWDSVGGMVVGLLGHLPTVGEHVEAGGFKFKVKQVARHRVATLEVSKTGDAEDG
jgi:CBS domain containing-hemolysin-like protein